VTGQNPIREAMKKIIAKIPEQPPKDLKSDLQNTYRQQESQAEDEDHSQFPH